nr:hypothetical protein [uncultured Carboxylicivirga sp.]
MDKKSGGGFPILKDMTYSKIDQEVIVNKFRQPFIAPLLTGVIVLMYNKKCIYLNKVYGYIALQE